MVEPSGLLPIVMGIGLTVLAGRSVATTRGRGRGEQSQWQAPFFDLAVLLIGFAIVGAALWVLGWSIESGHRLKPADARAENRFIIALGLLILATAAWTAWTGFFHSSATTPWERGHLDRIPQLISFTLAILVVSLVALGIDEALISTARIKGAPATFVIGAILILGLGLSWTILRLLSGGNPSPRAFALSRQQQLRLLCALEHASGSWVSVQVQALGELEPALAFSATIWVTQHGWYWRSEDALALPRYHSWAANHVTVPTPALHAQRLTMFAGPSPRSARGLRITQTTRRWLWRLDTWRTRRETLPPPADASSPERLAGLVHISPEQLQDAGLQVVKYD